MSLASMKKALSEPRLPECATCIAIMKQILLRLQKDTPWISRKAYALQNSCSPKTVERATPYLRRIGAARNEGKKIEYDPAVTIGGEMRFLNS